MNKENQVADNKKTARKRKAPGQYWVAETQDTPMEENQTKHVKEQTKKKSKSKEKFAVEEDDDDDLIMAKTIKVQNKSNKASKPKSSAAIAKKSTDKAKKKKQTDELIDHSAENEEVQGETVEVNEVVVDVMEDFQPEPIEEDSPDNTSVMMHTETESSTKSSPEDKETIKNLKKELEQTKKTTLALQKRYDSLKTIGIVEAEKRYDELKETVQKTSQAYEDVIHQLRDQLNKALSSPTQTGVSEEDLVQKLEQQAMDIKQKYEERERELSTQFQTARDLLSAQLEDAVEKLSIKEKECEEAKKKDSNNYTEPIKPLQRELKLFRELTGLIVTRITEESYELDDDEENEECAPETSVEEPDVAHLIVYTCKQTGEAGDLCFQMKIPREDSEYDQCTYVPLLGGGPESTTPSLEAALPPYLLEEIEFDRTMCPLFFWRVSDYMKNAH